MAEGYVYEASEWCEKCLPVGVDDPGVCSGGGESDTPSHCSHCRIPLEGSLTTDGMNYVLEHLVQELYDGPGRWNDVWCIPSLPEEYRTSNVVGVATGIVESEDRSKLPILADALMDAGYEGKLLVVLRDGIPGGVIGLECLLSAITGHGTDDDYYEYCRQVDVTRGWADELRLYGSATNEEADFADMFLRVTAPGVDAGEVVRELMNDPEAQTPFMDWEDLLQSWSMRTNGVGKR